MSLVVQIGSDVKAAVKGIEEVSLSLKEQKVILASLQKQYAALSTEQARSKIGRELAADIRIAQQEIKRLEVGAVSSFGKVGGAATKGFSALRGIANILPGLGIAGIFALAAEGIGALVRSLSNLGSELTKAKAEQEALNAAFKSNSYSKAVTDVNSLRINVELAKQGFLDKKDVLKQYNDTLGESIGKANSLDQAEQLLVKNGEAYIQMTLLKAAANIALQKAAEKAIEAQIEALRKEREQQGGRGRDVSGDDRGIRIEAERAGQRALEAARAAGKSDADIRKAYTDALNKVLTERRGATQLKDRDVFLDIAKDFQSRAAAIAKDFNLDFFGFKDPKINTASAEAELKRLAKAIQDVMEVPEGIVFKNFDTNEQALNKAKATVQGFFDGTIFKLKLQPKVSFSEPDVKSINLTELQNQLKGFEAQINIETDPTKLANLITAAENTRERIREIFSELTGEILKVFDNIDQSTGQTFRAGAVLGREFIDGVKSVTDTTTFTPDQKLFEVEALTTKFKKQFEELGSTLPAIDLSKSFFVNNVELQAKLDALKRQIIVSLNIEDIIDGIKIESLSNVGEAIGAALSGGDIKSAFENFGNIIGDGLQAIGKQLIITGVLAKKTQIALAKLFINPALAIAAGIALIAAGAALKNIVSGGVTTGRQAGGPVQGGKRYIVGEVGSELYVPKSGNPVMIGEKGRGLFVPPADGKIISRNELNKSVTNNDYTSNKTSKQAVQYVSNIGGDSSEVSNNTKKQSSTENKNATNNIYGTGYYLSSNRYVASDTRNVSNNSSAVSNVNTDESIINITKGVKVNNKVSPVLKPVFRSGIYNPSFVKVINTESSESNIGGSLVNRFNESNNYDSGSVLKYITSNTKQSIIDKERVNELINSSFSSNTINKLSGIGVELKAVMPGTPKRQVGGAVAGGQTILVGERGVEAFVPATAGRILPTNNLSQIQGAAVDQMGQLYFESKISGNDLKLILSRTDKYQKGNV